MAFSHLSKYRRGLSTRETERVNEAGLRESMEEDMVGKKGLWEKGRERAFLLNPGGERGKTEKGVSCRVARGKANRDGLLTWETQAGESTVCGRGGDTNPNIQMLNKAMTTYCKARTIDRQMSVRRVFGYFGK